MKIVGYYRFTFYFTLKYTVTSFNGMLLNFVLDKNIIIAILNGQINAPDFSYEYSRVKHL